MGRWARLALSVAAGVLVLVLVSWHGSSIRAEAERERQELLAAYGGDVVNVCVASRDIAAGDVLDEGDVQMEEWIAGLLPTGAATSIEDVVGKRATSSVPARAVLCPVYFQERAGALEVPEGMVAVSVPADPAHAVGGSIAPGDTVDVYLAGSGLADRICRATVIDTSAEQAGGAAAELSWVTVAVEPERVPELLAATAKGSVSLVVPGAGMEADVPASTEEADDARGADATGRDAAEASSVGGGMDDDGEPAGASAGASGGVGGGASTGEATDEMPAEGDGATTEKAERGSDA